MKKSAQIAIVMPAAGIACALMFASVAGFGQTANDAKAKAAAKAKAIAQAF